MSISDDEFHDEVEQDEELEVDESGEGIEAAAEGESEAEGEAASAKADPALDEEAGVRTVSSRELERKALEDQIQRFLAQGGHIQELAPDETQKL